MAQYGYSDGVDLDPSVMDYLIKKQNPSYQPSRAQAVLEELESVKQRQASPEYQARLAASKTPSLVNDLMPALAKLSAQFGTIRGKSADTSAIDDMSSAMERRRQQQMLLGEQNRQAGDAYDEARLAKAFTLDKRDSEAAKMAYDRQRQGQETADKKRKEELDRADKNREFSFKDREFNQKQSEIDQRRKETEQQYATTIDGIDDQGNPVTRVLNKKGDTIQTFASSKAKASDNAFKALPQEAQRELNQLSDTNAGLQTIGSAIDEQLNNMYNAYQKGDKKQAIIAGRQMLKDLNSTAGKDAIGSEEAARLGGLLEYQMFNLTQPGPIFGRDIKGFYEQAALKSNAVKGIIKGNRDRIKRLYEGNYQESMANVPQTLPEFGETAPKPGTAYASPVQQQAKPDGAIETLGGVQYRLTNGKWVEVE